MTEILQVFVRTYPQPDGCVGLKIGIELDEPSEAKATLATGEVVAVHTLPTTWKQFGAIYPGSSLHDPDFVFMPPQLVEGVSASYQADDAPPHDPFHGAKPEKLIFG